MAYLLALLYIIVLYIGLELYANCLIYEYYRVRIILSTNSIIDE